MIIKNSISLLILCLIFCLKPNLSTAQDKTNYSDYAGKFVYVKTKDNNEYSGRVMEVDNLSISILTESKERITIQIENIQSIALDNKLGSGNDKSDELYPTRYIFTPSYLRLEKGDNYGRLAIWGMEMDYAVSKRWTIGMMMSWLGSPVAFNGKFAFPLSKKVHVGIGGLLAWGGLLIPSATLALPFAGITFGDAKSNLTMTAGYGLSSFVNTTDIYNQGTQLAFGFAGMKKTKEGATLLFETVVIPSVPGSNNLSFVFTPSIRFHRKYTRSMQAGLTLMMINGKIVASPVPAISWIFKVF